MLKAPIIMSKDQLVFWDVAEKQLDADHKYYLNLFKAEVDKLTMISREQNLHLDKWEGVEAQFNHTKKQLLDLMEE